MQPAMLGIALLRFHHTLLRRIAMEMIQRLLRDEEGVTAIEYGLIACLIALGIILAVTAAGEKIAAIFDRIAALPVPA